MQTTKPTKKPQYKKKEKYKVTRRITEAECPWIPGSIPVGTILYRYYGPTFGIIKGIPVKENLNEHNFFGVPEDAIKLCK